MTKRKTSGGQPDNNNAGEGRQLTAMFNHALSANNRQKMREGIQKLADAFANGERWAIEFAFDRKEGKAIQTTNVNITKSARELTDEELNAIASGSRVTFEANSEEEPNSVH